MVSLLWERLLERMSDFTCSSWIQIISLPMDLKDFQSVEVPPVQYGLLPPTLIAPPMLPTPSVHVPPSPLLEQACPGAHVCQAQCIVHQPRYKTGLFPTFQQPSLPGAPMLSGGHPFVRLSDGQTYRGEWHRGKMHGQGIVNYPPPGGGMYEGEFHDGRRHGQGTRTYPDGSRYTGDWFKGKRHGQATLTYVNGIKHRGEWHEGDMHGQFTRIFPDGRKIEEVWRKGVYRPKASTRPSGW